MSKITVDCKVLEQVLESLEDCVKTLDALFAPGNSIYTRAADSADRAAIALRAAIEAKLKKKKA